MTTLLPKSRPLSSYDRTALVAVTKIQSSDKPSPSRCSRQKKPMATQGGLFAAKTWANLSQIPLLPGLLRKVKCISNDENKKN